MVRIEFGWRGGAASSIEIALARQKVRGL